VIIVLAVGLNTYLVRRRERRSGISRRPLNVPAAGALEAIR